MNCKVVSVCPTDRFASKDTFTVICWGFAAKSRLQSPLVKWQVRFSVFSFYYIKRNLFGQKHQDYSFTKWRCFCFSFQILEEREEPGFLTGLKIPAPWAAGKTVETVHPVRDNFKFKETVHIPGARCLYLRFDPRCSSQYDYDKVSIVSVPVE